MTFINLADPIVQSVRSHTDIIFIHDIYMLYAFCIEGNGLQPVCNYLCQRCIHADDMFSWTSIGHNQYFFNIFIRGALACNDNIQTNTHRSLS